MVVGREKRGWRERERWYECIANIARYLFCLDGGAVFWFERISIELVSLRVEPRVCECARARVYEQPRRQPMAADTPNEASKTWLEQGELKSFLNPVRRLNSFSNIEGGS